MEAMNPTKIARIDSDENLRSGWRTIDVLGVYKRGKHNRYIHTQHVLGVKIARIDSDETLQGGWRTIPKLTCWVGRTNPSTFGLNGGR